MLFATLCRSVLAWKFNHRLFGITLEKTGNLANDVNFFGPEFFADLPDQSRTGIPVGAQLDFYQLVMLQRHFDFRQYVFAQALIAYHDYGLQMVCQSTQITNLSGCKWHVVIPGMANCFKGSGFYHAGLFPVWQEVKAVKDG
jgi:hypothetical protein